MDKGKSTVSSRRMQSLKHLVFVAVLIALAGVALFLMMVALSRAALGSWHESELPQGG